MQEKIEKAKLHRVISTGTMEHRFEVLCKDRTGRGIRRDRVVQESLITVDGKAFCSCMKPKLLHLPCSHLIAACAESALQPGVFVSPNSVLQKSDTIYATKDRKSQTTPRHIDRYNGA